MIPSFITILSLFRFQDEVDELVKKAKELVVSTMQDLQQEKADNQAIINTIRKTLTNYFLKETKRKPMIITIIH